MHIICQEGYYDMLAFMFDPTKHTRFDHVKLNLNVYNDRRRTPFMLCFTPPSATYMGESIYTFHVVHSEILTPIADS